MGLDIGRKLGGREQTQHIAADVEQGVAQGQPFQTPARDGRLGQQVLKVVIVHQCQGAEALDRAIAQSAQDGQHQQNVDDNRGVQQTSPPETGIERGCQNTSQEGTAKHEQDQHQADRRSHLKPRHLGSLHWFFKKGGRVVDRSGPRCHGVIGSLVSSLFPR
jgi:hypothetical protein